MGTGSGTEKIMKLLKKDIEVIAFIDNNFTKHNNIFKGKSILGPRDICDIYYDYIIIGSVFFFEINQQLIDLGVNESKIVQFYKYGINEIEYLFNHINKKNIKVIATGLSYMYNALDTSITRESSINLAVPSQDLYHDYSIVNHILNKKLSQIKYVIIGLAYYSFHWDISKSSLDYFCTKYMRILNFIPESRNKEKNIEEFNNFLRQSKELFVANFNAIAVKDTLSSSLNGILNEENKKIGKQQAQIHNKKQYEQTVKENIIIMNKYLSLLKEHNIKPVLVVCPVSKYYYKYFPERLKNEFYKIIEDISKNYKFQFIDYFYPNKFIESDFSDPSHLNQAGAIKFTQMLNEDIAWYLERKEV